MSSKPETPRQEAGCPPSKMSSLKSTLRDIFWARRGLVLLGVVLILVGRLAGLVLPASTKHLFDGVIANDDTGLLFLLVGLVGGSVVVRAATSYALTILLGIEGHKIIAQLRSRVQKHVLELPVRFFDRAKSGELASRVMEDVAAAPNLIGTGLVQFVGGAITTIVTLVFLVRIDLVMTLLAIVPLAVFAWISVRASKKLRSAFRERRKLKAEVVGRLAEGLGGIRTVKGFSATRVEGEAFHAGAMKILAETSKTMKLSSILTSGSTFFIGMAGVLILVYGGQAVVSGEITTGELVSFTVFLAMLATPIAQITDVGAQVTDVLAGLDRTFELLSWPQEGDDPNRVVTMPEVRGHLVFEDVHFGYEANQPVLEGISFEAKRGMMVAVVGSSGVGKSTVTTLAAAFRTPDRGRVLVDGVDLRKVKLASYRRQLGLVLQDDFFFDGTILENMRFGRPSASEAEVRAAAEHACVNEFSDRFPDGLDTVIGERGIKLSGGQRQRMAIGRAMLADPRILILDEATSSLDTESEALIQESLAKLMLDRTTLVAAHRLSTIRRANLILVMENGRIVERGQHDALMAQGGRYHQLYTVQARI